MGKHIIEFIGTFFLVFVIVLTTNDPQIWGGGGTPFAPFAIAAILMVMVFNFCLCRRPYFRRGF
ncbi:MAG: hypothetical protein ABI855_12670 [Bacteroidota bacterium]